MDRAIEILLVEDNPGDVRLTQEAFREGKVLNNLSVVGDGVEAISFLRREGQHVDAPHPDLILLDLNLPKMDGHEVLEKLKADTDLKSIPVVVLSTSDNDQDILQAYELHVNCYITKPVDMHQFFRAIGGIEQFWFQIVRLPPSLKRVNPPPNDRA